MSSQGKVPFGCPQCGKVLSVDIEHAGKKAKCIGCGAVVFVPRNRLDLLILEHQRNVSSLQSQEDTLTKRLDELGREFSTIQAERDASELRLKALQGEIAVLEENLEDISYGIYKPHFTFQTSQQYKAALTELWTSQKYLVRLGAAASCATTWTVGGSAREGERMIKQHQKLLLRAFNGEADAAIAKVTWSNYRVMETRIRKRRTRSTNSAP